jgi:hypothetical protein
MALPLQHTTCSQAEGHMTPFSLVRGCLTARPSQLIRAAPDHFPDLGPDDRQSAHLHDGQRQAIGGVVLFGI